MSSQGQKAAVITGASQGIGAELVAACHQFGHRVAATWRTLATSQDPDLITVQGDICDPTTAERVIGTASEQLRRPVGAPAHGARGVWPGDL